MKRLPLFLIWYLQILAPCVLSCVKFYLVRFNPLLSLVILYSLRNDGLFQLPTNTCRGYACFRQAPLCSTTVPPSFTTALMLSTILLLPFLPFLYNCTTTLLQYHHADCTILTTRLVSMTTTTSRLAAQTTKMTATTRMVMLTTKTLSTFWHQARLLTMILTRQ